ncbi:phage integrase family protein [Paraburkholderia eburnea]|uniref:Phage integrase family protein n=2 Tax=Paraburkholderia eburnea TaxID=1189126 RepID=A0A2S4MG38_9BURK|nr:phage integrase family protein [Paraburkholderia eburnea]PRZ25567.1 phage integrase family protein [Paraburkholderia eburnea]
MFEAWHPEAMAENTPKGALRVRRLFEFHFLPQVASVRLLEVKSEHVRKPVRALIDAGKVSTAISLYVYTSAMFVWAAKRKPWRFVLDVSPAEEVDIDRMVPADYQSWCERVLADDEIVELRNRFQVMRQAFEAHHGTRKGLARPMAREHELAIWIMLATLARINEMCAACWTHIDFDAGTWFIPPSQSKNRKSFTIYLSRFALRLFKELRDLTGHTGYVLPHTKVGGVPMTTDILRGAISSRQSWGKWKKKARPSAATAGALFLHGGPWSCHDLCRTGATLMQACGFDEGIVERCLNHSIATQTRRKGLNSRLVRTYQRYDYEREMRAAWQALGDYLTKLDGALTQIAGPDEMIVANDDSAEPPQIETA